MNKKDSFTFEELLYCIRNTTKMNTHYILFIKHDVVKINKNAVICNPILMQSYLTHDIAFRIEFA